MQKVTHIHGYVKGDIVIHEESSRAYMHNGHETHPWVEHLGQESGEEYGLMNSRNDVRVVHRGRMMNTYERGIPMRA